MFPKDPSVLKYDTCIGAPNGGIAPKPPFPNIISIPQLLAHLVSSHRYVF